MQAVPVSHVQSDHCTVVESRRKSHRTHPYWKCPFGHPEVHWVVRRGPEPNRKGFDHRLRVHPDSQCPGSTYAAISLPGQHTNGCQDSQYTKLQGFYALGHSVHHLLFHGGRHRCHPCGCHRPSRACKTLWWKSNCMGAALWFVGRALLVYVLRF
jgi:hypothetical protein